MKLEVGIYVRTKYGIAKYIHKLVTKETIYYVIDKKIVYENVEDWEDVLSSNEILKASHNIIDLIEVGDYVNGYKITSIQEIEEPYYPKRLLCVEEPQDYVWQCFNNDDIKSIVTKEQFESMSYKIGD